MDAKQKMDDFVYSVTRDLSDEIFDAVEKFQRRASMHALKREVERVQRISKQDEPAITGQHMDHEFDLALQDWHGSKNPDDIVPGDVRASILEERDRANSDEIEESKNAFFARQANQAKKVENPANVSISNLQMAVRMTLLASHNQALSKTQNESSVAQIIPEEEEKVNDQPDAMAMIF